MEVSSQQCIPSISVNETAIQEPSVSSRLIVVSNRLPFVLKRDEVTGRLERKSRYVRCFVRSQYYAVQRGNASLFTEKEKKGKGEEGGKNPLSACSWEKPLALRTTVSWPPCMFLTYTGYASLNLCEETCSRSAPVGKLICRSISQAHPPPSLYHCPAHSHFLVLCVPFSFQKVYMKYWVR